MLAEAVASLENEEGLQKVCADFPEFQADMAVGHNHDSELAPLDCSLGLAFEEQEAIAAAAKPSQQAYSEV